MTIESKKDLPKRYQELADEAGFKAVLDSLDKSPADMTAVAEVEAAIERESRLLQGEYLSLEKRLEGLAKSLATSLWQRGDAPDYGPRSAIALGIAIVALILSASALIF